MCKHFYIIDITGTRHATQSGDVVVCTKCNKVHKELTKKLRKLKTNTFVYLMEEQK